VTASPELEGEGSIVALALDRSGLERRRSVFALV
jgi:hypothetical protein